MKSLKLKTLILSSLVATATITPCLTSCSKKSTISVSGATIDTSKSHIEVNRDSTIYLIPNSGSKITGIKSISVGSTLLTRMSYQFEYEQQANGLAYKLTIFAKSMTSVNVAIEVHTTDIEITSATYSGNTQKTTAALTPLSLEVKAKYKDVEGDTPLAAGEFKVIDNSSGLETDVTDKYLSVTGYRMDEAKTYNFIIKSAIDSSKTTDLSITIIDPYVNTCEGEEYPTTYEHFDTECKVKIKDSAKDLDGTIEPEKFYVFNRKEKKVTAIADNGFAGCKATIIKFISDCEITNIQANAFTNCTNLTAINIPSKVASIEADAFATCSALTVVCLDSQAIVNLTTDGSKLLSRATNVFVQKDLTVPETSYVYLNYNKGTTIGNYTQWTKK